MMSASLESSLAELTAIQSQAVDWDTGPLLVLTGPGSGATRVITCRIARLLDRSRGQRFRILALASSSGTARAMANAVASLVPGLVERTTIVTLHGFCTQVLRQHGVHRRLNTNFAIYSQTTDRLALLGDALRRAGVHHTHDTAQQLLPWIDYLKDRLVEPEQAESHLAAINGAAAVRAGQVAQAYRLYEKELRRGNALDLSSLVFETYRLFKPYPIFAKHYQTAYRYWLVDQFQDTHGAQYALLRSMAQPAFRNLFVVADDDRTASERNGASVRRIRDFVRNVGCKVMQLPANFRCPPDIVESASRLAIYHGDGVESIRPATATTGHSVTPNVPPIRRLAFATDAQEIAGVAGEIVGLNAEERGSAAVLARRRAPLQALRDALKKRDIPAYLDLRSGDFASAEMRWFAACMEQVRRPMDRRNMALLVGSFEQFSAARADWEEISSRAESEGVTWLAAWLDSVRGNGAADTDHALVAPVAKLAAGAITPAAAAGQVLACFENRAADDDLKEDLEAWRRIDREAGNGNADRSPARLLPAPVPGAVTLTTLHGARGREFDTVYLIGLSEGILPSCRSIRTEADDDGAAMDEERRACFVAITGARQRVILSRARRYRGWEKEPSRFLAEMGYAECGPPAG